MTDTAENDLASPYPSSKRMSADSSMTEDSPPLAADEGEGGGGREKGGPGTLKGREVGTTRETREGDALAGLWPGRTSTGPARV